MVMVILALLGPAMGCTSPEDRLVGGVWISQTGATLEFSKDGKMEFMGMLSGYEINDSTISINGQPAYESVTWVSDDEFMAQDVRLSGLRHEQRFTRER